MVQRGGHLPRANSLQESEKKLLKKLKLTLSLELKPKVVHKLE